MPVDLDVLRLSTPFNALVSGITEHVAFLAMQQCMSLRDIVDVGGRATTVCTSPDSASAPMCAFMPKW
jgi:hypothetical protein